MIGADTPGTSFGVDTAGIREKISELADQNLNGRQIRTAISTARQQAMYKREPMGYKHLKIVINEANKIKEKVLELHNGRSTDQMAREDGQRRDTMFWGAGSNHIPSLSTRRASWHGNAGRLGREAGTKFVLEKSAAGTIYCGVFTSTRRPGNNKARGAQCPRLEQPANHC